MLIEGARRTVSMKSFFRSSDTVIRQREKALERRRTCASQERQSSPRLRHLVRDHVDERERLQRGKGRVERAVDDDLVPGPFAVHLLRDVLPHRTERKLCLSYRELVYELFHDEKYDAGTCPQRSGHHSVRQNAIFDRTVLVISRLERAALKHGREGRDMLEIEVVAVRVRRSFSIMIP